MKQKIMFLSVISILFMVFCIDVNAECSYEESSKLKSIASNIYHDYFYKENDEKNSIAFTVRFENVLQQLKIYDVANQNVTPGKTYHYRVGMAAASIKNNKITYQERVGDHFETRVIDLGTSTCNIDDILTITISIPSYNQFYQSDICKKYSENKMCDKWYQHNYTYEKFSSEVLASEKKQTNIKGEEKKEKGVTFFDILMEFLGKYYLSLIGTVILIVGIIVLYIDTKKKMTDFEGWK